MIAANGLMYVSWVCRHCGKGDIAKGHQPIFALPDTPILCTCMGVTASDPL
jgi:hypothetical protein